METTNKEGKGKALDFTKILHPGKANIKTTAELMRITGIRSVRMFRLAISRARKEGQCICSSKGRISGYYLAENQEEAARCWKILYKEGISLITAASKGLKGTAETIDGQLAIHDLIRELSALDDTMEVKDKES